MLTFGVWGSSEPELSQEFATLVVFPISILSLWLDTLMLKSTLPVPFTIVNQKNMDPNSWAKHNFKGKARVSTGFFYIVMAFEIIIEIDLGSEWNFPVWCSKHPFLPTAASRPSYSSCSWNSSMALTFSFEKKDRASMRFGDLLAAVECKHFVKILSKQATVLDVLGQQSHNTSTDPY